MEQLIGEIRIFGGRFAPLGWVSCEGQLLPIYEYDALFNLIGTTYGGDGMELFGVPDLRGRVAVSQGQGQGLSSRWLGEFGGQEEVAVTSAQTATHSHTLMGSNAIATVRSPDKQVLSKTAGVNLYFSPLLDPVDMKPTGPSNGGSTPHENRMPYLSMTHIMATTGIWPSQG